MLLPLLALLFIVVPVAELALLIEVGREIGAVPTIAMVILVGIGGATLARLQGTLALRRLHADLARGVPPGAALLDGALVLVAAVLLLTPGLLTDAVALLLFIPPVRRLVGRGIAAWAKGRIQVHAPGRPVDRSVIDGEVVPRAPESPPPEPARLPGPDGPGREVDGPSAF